MFAVITSQFVVTVVIENEHKNHNICLSCIFEAKYDQRDLSRKMHILCMCPAVMAGACTL